MLNTLQRRELISLQRLLYASAIGSTAGMTAVMVYSLGAFIPSLQAEFGWSRGDISLGATSLTLALFFTGSIAGRLCDRYGAAVVGAVSLVAYAIAVVVMVSFMRELHHFWIGYFLVAVLGVGSTPIVLVRPVATEFQAARGVALGIALTGAGIAGFWVPRLVAHVTADYGWREAYFALAGIAMLTAPIVWFGFRPRSQHPALHNATDNTTGDSEDVLIAPAEEGMSHSEARRSRGYWVLSLMSFAMAAGMAGIVIHLVPLFIDLGVNQLEAAKMASVVGVASVIGRMGIGYLLDKLPTVLVTISVLLLSSLGMFLLWGFGLGVSYVSVALLGLAAGAEIDLLAYLTYSYFGRRHYGAIYGWQYSIFALGYGISPYLIGRLYDVSGDYQLPLIFSGCLIVLAAISCLWLPKKGSRERVT
ncbi:MAG: MFS transporter [Pseudomonadales bacterium]|nr:MFS transporter [Pseudomonadales bacterium]